MSDIEMAPWLTDQIRNGEGVLFLGAGASIGAKKKDGTPAPSSDKLKEEISKKFLGGEKLEESLASVADYANYESSLTAVQSLVRDLYQDLEPADFHLIIPQFRWRAIFTTNYDQIIEEAYKRCPGRLQSPIPIIRDKANMRQVLEKGSEVVPLIKLHGCISCVDDDSLPLILASEQYAKYRTNRKNLFKFLQEVGMQHPLFFCGYRIEDWNIQSILFDLTDLGIRRPKYALIRPNLTKLDKDVWGGRRFDVLSASFQDFLIHIDNIIPTNQRMLSKLISRDAIPVSRWFKTKQEPSEKLREYLANELEYLHAGMPSAATKPMDFYHGLSHSWDVFTRDLDLRREITDKLLLDWILGDDGTAGVRVLLLQGHAGSGKKVTLRRVAWEAATTLDALVFYLKEGGLVRNPLIDELSQLLQRRFFIFVDDILRISSEIKSLLEYCRRQNIPITLVGGARTNEWNVHGTDLVPYISDEQALHTPTDGEIEVLLGKLETNKCLGHLIDLNHGERVEILREKSKRQLLVALHEVTSGKRFVDHVFDEYQRITPAEAKVLYLDICTLHRLNAPVRAGLVNRISGISISDFRKDFFQPLEHVVKTYYDTSVGDWAYRSRHPMIATFVFRRALPDPGMRVDQILRMMSHLIVDYVSDEIAFSQLIDGKSLAKEFSDRQLVDQIYDVAEQSGADQSYVAQQRARFELRHRNGSTRRARDFIEKASEAATHSKPTIDHTRAVIFRKMANEATNRLEKERYRKQARDILTEQLRHIQDSYPYTTLVQLQLDELKEMVSQPDLIGEAKNPSLADRVLVDTISECDRILGVATQKFPEEEFLLSLRAEFATLLQDEPAARKALEEAFEISPRNDVVAVRLARIMDSSGQPNDAIEVLKRCIDQNQQSRTAHYEIAQLYRKLGEQKHHESISYHLYNSFTHGDSNHLAQMYYARHEFLYGDKGRATEVFGILRKQRIPPKLRKQKFGIVLDENGKLIEYQGAITNITSTFCFARIVSLQEDIFIYYEEFSDDHWRILRENHYISCNLCFTLRGPCGINARFVS